MTFDSTRRACVKCGVELFPKKNGVRVNVSSEGGARAADLWACPVCGMEIVTGFAGSSFPPCIPDAIATVVDLPMEPGHQLVCRECQKVLAMVVVKIGVLELASYGPYKLWKARLYVCTCGKEVAVPDEDQARWHHYMRGFAEALEEAKCYRMVEIRELTDAEQMRLFM